VPYAVYVYNTTTHTATEYTPFELVYRFKSEVPSALRNSPTIHVQYNYEDYLIQLKGMFSATPNSLETGQVALIIIMTLEESNIS
jgi:hypothetical protein